MRTDITPQLLEATSLRPAWSADRARSLANALTEAIPDAWVDWDEDSGEEWARILEDRFVVALVRAKLPLAIIVRGEANRLRQLNHGAVAIVVDDMDTPLLTATGESVRRAFPEREVSPTLDPAAFSAMDLWFATT
jgi:hypothetical protein